MLFLRLIATTLIRTFSMLKELYEQARSLAPKDTWPTFDGKELDRTEFLTSSEVSRCLRWTFFSKYPDQYPLPVGKGGSNGYADRGHAVEAKLVKYLRLLEKIGYRFDYMGEDQRSFYDADLGLSGTPDGIMYTPAGEIYLLEFKSIDPRFNKANLPKKGHPHQTVQNMALVQKCLGINFTGGILFYVDASDVWKVTEFAIEYRPELIELSSQRADLLWDAEEPDDLEAEGLYNGDCDLCPFTHHCSQSVNMTTMLQKAGEAAVPFLESLEPTELEIGELHEIQHFLEAREAEKMYGKEKEDVADYVKHVVIQIYNGLVKLPNGTLLVGNELPGRETLQKDLLVAAGIDLEPFTKRGKPYTMLTVKEPEEE